MSRKTEAAATCRSCGRVLMRNRQDTDAAAVKRAKWSNIETVAGRITGVCRPCGKKGNR